MNAPYGPRPTAMAHSCIQDMSKSLMGQLTNL